MIFDGPIYIHSKATLKDRIKGRKVCGPYMWTPVDVDKWLKGPRPTRGRGFYQSSKGLSCGDSTFDLRLSLANDHLGSFQLRNITGYYCDNDSDDGDTLKPIVARLPHGRGFLAGWTMGEGMCASIDFDIYGTIEDAARAAHSKAEYDAEESRMANAKYQEEERQREKQEELEDEEQAKLDFLFSTHAEVIL